MARKGRPRRTWRDAREFGRQVEAELARPGSKVEAAMAVIHQRDPQRWGSRSKMYELWAEYRRLKGKLIVERLPHALRDIRDFGRQVEVEIANGSKVEAAMAAIHQQDPPRWGSRSKMHELWAEYLRLKGKLVLALPPRK